jgi:hypothetical protein
MRKKDEVAAAARERERERERRSEESFPQHKFYYEKLSDKKNATDYTRVLVHIIY